MILLIILAFVLFFMYAYVPFRLLILHPVKTVRYLVQDIYHYFKHNMRFYYEGGVLNCYFAHFGGGKTLSVVHYITVLFNHYNNRYVWDRGRRKLVLQKVHVISNVHLSNIPYEELSSLSQIVCCAWRNKELDDQMDTRTVVLVLLDEASAQLNSREFKTNINADFLNTLITSRHFAMSIFYTSQKFKLVDALLRNVTQRCIWCDKIWRFMVQYTYDADEMEYAINPLLVKPIRRSGFFVTDQDYDQYDTLATVSKLKKSVDAGEMLSDQEILALRGSINPDTDQINPTRKLRRRRRK